MKTIFAISLLFLLPAYSFADSFPVKMPADFSIMYVLGGGTHGIEKTIRINRDLCTDSGSKFYSYEMSYQVQKESLETLYHSLRKLNAFKLEFETFASYDSYGTTIAYTINNEYYYVLSMNDAVIIPQHREAFNQSVQLILDFTKTCRKYNLDHKINILEKEIPDTMPADFAVNYYYAAEGSGSNMGIFIHLGDCYYMSSSRDMGDTVQSFKIKNRHALEKLYRDLKKQHAFTLWSLNTGNELLSEIGPAIITYTINGKTYQLSISNLVEEHKGAFSTSVQTIIDFAHKCLFN